ETGAKAGGVQDLDIELRNFDEQPTAGFIPVHREETVDLRHAAGAFPDGWNRVGARPGAALPLGRRGAGGKDQTETESSGERLEHGEAYEINSQPPTLSEVEGLEVGSWELALLSPSEARHLRPRPVMVRVGCSGWQYRHWRGNFYPADLPLKSWFEHYAAVFDTVEINNSFYRLPEASTFAAWAARAPRGFLFAVKASRFLTHMKKLKDPEDPLDRFFGRAR